MGTILESVRKTGHLVLVDQATRHASAAAVIAAEVAERGFGLLKAPLRMVTALDTSIPYSEPLENHVLPNEQKIAEAVKLVLAKQAVAA
jgi:pyruvate dehydrogenase E1 component beta subunit